MSADTNPIESVANDLIEGTEEIHGSNKKKYDAHRKTFKERHAEATAPKPGIVEKFVQEKDSFVERHAEATARQPGIKEKFEKEKDDFLERHSDITKTADPKS